MELTNTLYVSTLAEWRAWLAENHTSVNEVWLIYYKAASNRPTLAYEESIEEALCFGWVDSLIQRIDAERYARLFTPRLEKSRWSETNKKRVRKLVHEGRMTPAGIARVTFPLDESQDIAPVEPRLRDFESLPPEIQQPLLDNPAAWEFFNSLPPSHRRTYLGWVMSAKKDETRQRRLVELIGVLARREKLGLK